MIVLKIALRSKEKTNLADRRIRIVLREFALLDSVTPG